MKHQQSNTGKKIQAVSHASVFQRAGKKGAALTDNRNKCAATGSGEPVQLMKVSMPDGSEVDTDYMSAEQLDEAMAILQQAMHAEHWASPMVRHYETNYHKLSSARLQQGFGKHLLVGEGDFGFGHAQSKEHAVKLWQPPVHATEFRQRAALEEAYPDTFKQNASKVKEYGGSVQYGVDAMDMEQSLPPQHFPMITSMFPHTGSRNRARDGPLTHDVVGGLFSQGTKYQEPGDRIFLTVPSSYSSETRHRTYGMQRHAPAHDYELVNKFAFNPVNHPPYEHKMTKENKSANSMEESATGVTYSFLKKPKGKAAAYDSDYEPESEPEDVYASRDKHS